MIEKFGASDSFRAGGLETCAMKISRDKTQSVFDRYNITSHEDLKEVATPLGEYILKKMVHFRLHLTYLSPQRSVKVQYK